MPYRARRIPLSCGEKPVRDLAAYMADHLGEVRQSLVREGVQHEQWYLRVEDDGLALIAVMDVADLGMAQRAAATSDLPVNAVHRRFKRHWRRDQIEDLKIDPTVPPTFDGAKCLLDVRL